MQKLIIFDCFSGHSGPSCFGSPLRVIILSMFMSLRSALTDCNPLDVSVVKDYTCVESFIYGMLEVCKQLNKQGIQPENVTVDTRMSVIKEISAKWIVGHIRTEEQAKCNYKWFNKSWYYRMYKSRM